MAVTTEVQDTEQCHSTAWVPGSRPEGLLTFLPRRYLWLAYTFSSPGLYPRYQYVPSRRPLGRNSAQRGPYRVPPPVALEACN